MLINAGIKKVIHQGDFRDEVALQFLEEAGIEVVKVPFQSR